MTMTLNLLPASGAPPGFPFPENHVRARLGVSEDELRALRQKNLREGSDYCRGKKGRVWLAAAGVEALVQAKSLGDGSKRPDAPGADAEGSNLQPPTSKKTGAPAPAELKFVRACKNPHIIECCALEDDDLKPRKLVRVRVRASGNFRRGMGPLPVQLVAGYTDLYDLTRPCPKKPGKW